jgi:hypothetical protein
MASIPGSGDQPLFLMTSPVDEKARAKAIKALKYAEPEFRKVGLSITASMAEDLIADLEGEKQKSQNYQWLVDQVSIIEKLADKELQGKFFLYIPPERAKFWPQRNAQNPLGEDVMLSFPSTTFDAANAGICLATMMSTACVFHLMRVLEIGLAALGNVFGISLAHTNWEPAIREIESKIREMHKDPAWKAHPDCKEQQEYYAQAASHFGILKDAWRNHTMHVRGKYTEVEAERIFETVKALMQKLAERLEE